jgi:hypothetical protein
MMNLDTLSQVLVAALRGRPLPTMTFFQKAALGTLLLEVLSTGQLKALLRQAVQEWLATDSQAREELRKWIGPGA